jgi:antitoxin ParD1/3/4
MTLSLNSELQQFVDEQVRSGRFSSPDAAIAEAVRLMKAREEKLAWLRREIQVATDQIKRGEAAPWDVEETKARLRERLAKKNEGR